LGVPLGVGHVLHGKYRLVRLLGDGGMGAVYEATHQRLGTHVAIKVLHAEISLRPGIVERFLQEARVSAQIRSPHVAQVIDVDQTPEGDAYMVMELLEGETLLHLLDRERKLSIAVACAFTLQVLEALEAAHSLGVVHRDLKPENVFVTHGTQRTVVKLIDFGIAKVHRDGAANLTLAGVAMGTAEYMAPEQAFSADRADARSDLYAVGVMLYEMLSGLRPVEGDDPRTIAAKVERGEIKALVHALPTVPPPLAGFAHRAMAARPEMRFQSAAEMRVGLEKLVSHDAGGTLPLHLIAPVASSQEPPTTQATAAPSTLRGTPIDHAYGPPPPLLDDSVPPPPTRSSALPLIALAVLLGVAAVVGLAFLQQPRASAIQKAGASVSQSSEPAVGSLAVVTSAPVSTSATADGTSALRPLSTKGPAATARAASHADAGATPVAPNTGTGFSFPTSIPLPSNTILPLPSEIPLPGFGP
jgi:eukaryotic-like serine/threonine-protein kinase